MQHPLRGRPTLRSGVTGVDLEGETLILDAGTGVLLRSTSGPVPLGAAELERLGLTAGSRPLDRRELIKVAAAAGLVAVVLPDAAAAASDGNAAGASGVVDTGFDANIAQDLFGLVDDVAIRADGGLLVAGKFSRVGTSDLQDVALLTTSGAVASGFEDYARYSASGYGAYAALDTGSALIVGASYSQLSDVDANVAFGGPVFTVDGDGDAAKLLFSGAGNPDDSVLALAEDADGKILVGGYFANIAFEDIPTLARLLPNGIVDASFSPFDVAEDTANGQVRSIAVMPSGRIVIGGAFQSVGGVTRPGAAILEANGLVADGLTANLDGNVNAVAIDRNGRILLGGAFTEVDGAAQVAVARYHANGVLDDTFVPAIDFGYVNSIAVQTNGRIVVGGSFSAGDPTTFESEARIDNLARLHDNGALDRSLPDLDLDGDVDVVRIMDSGALVVGGTFTRIGGEDRTYLARLT